MTNIHNINIINVKQGKKYKITEDYKMVKTYSDCVKEYGNQYQLEKAVASGKLYKLEEGIYSDEQNVPEIAMIATKYPKAILSGEYAFFYYGFTDVIPEKYSMATKSKAAKISDDRVFQIYVRDDLFDLGVQKQDVDGYEIKIYDRRI